MPQAVKNCLSSASRTRFHYPCVRHGSGIRSIIHARQHLLHYSRDSRLPGTRAHPDMRLHGLGKQLHIPLGWLMQPAVVASRGAQAATGRRRCQGPSRWGTPVRWPMRSRCIGGRHTPVSRHNRTGPAAAAAQAKQAHAAPVKTTHQHTNTPHASNTPQLQVALFSYGGYFRQRAVALLSHQRAGPALCGLFNFWPTPH